MPPVVKPRLSDRGVSLMLYVFCPERSEYYCPVNTWLAGDVISGGIATGALGQEEGD